MMAKKMRMVGWGLLCQVYLEDSEEHTVLGTGLRNWKGTKFSSWLTDLLL
jgi:hypothetical protein